MRLFFSIIILIFSVSGFSQETKTTPEEYKFLTEEYPETNEIKLGYELETIRNVTVDKYTYHYQLFRNKITKEVKAVYITVKKEKGKNDKIRHLCMPFNDTLLCQDFEKSSKKLGVTMEEVYNSVNRFLLAELINEKYNSSKSSKF